VYCMQHQLASVHHMCCSMRSPHLISYSPNNKRHMYHVLRGCYNIKLNVWYRRKQVIYPELNYGPETHQQTAATASDAVGLAFLRCGGASPPAATRSRKTRVAHRRIKIERCIGGCGGERDEINNNIIIMYGALLYSMIQIGRNSKNQ
jgi:hypothetical protein